MARTVRDTALGSRAARERLKSRHEPYWRAIEKGAHLGYRKGSRGGAWSARLFLEGVYHKTTLGNADDVRDANGISVLSFSQAQDKARAWFDQMARRAAGLGPVSEGPCTVKQVMEDYLAWYKKHRKDYVHARYRVDALILPALGATHAAKLTTQKIQAWLNELAERPARARTGRGRAQRYRTGSSNQDHVRRRRASANRTFAYLKAALNRAWHDGKVASDEAWRRVRPFRNVEAPVVRYLTESECVRLVNACGPAFGQLVRAALLTGCRYGELTTLLASDFNPDSGTLTVRETKSGKPRHVVLTEEGQRFFASATAGRPSGHLVFLRDDGKPWGHSHQARPLTEACRRARIKPAVSFHVLRHTHGSQLAMAGVPTPVIAKQLGHADTRVTERHYAHLGPSYVAKAIRAGFPELGILGKSKVVALKPHD